MKLYFVAYDADPTEAFCGEFRSSLYDAEATLREARRYDPTRTPKLWSIWTGGYPQQVKERAEREKENES